MRPILASLVEKVYRETVVREELIHKVMLGPFSHIVDDGLGAPTHHIVAFHVLSVLLSLPDARKATFECIDTLVENCLDALEPQAW